ncbi:MAG: RNA polymerase sigma factor [Dehalococcoidia bacterium]
MTTAQLTASNISGAILPEDAEMATMEQQEFVPSDAAFTAMVEQYSDLAYNVALRMLRNPDDAEDAVQEAFISAYRAFPRFKGQSKLSTWLYRIVVNACLMKIRKDKSRSKYLADSGYDDSLVPDWRSANDPEHSALNSELQGQLEQGLEMLSPELRSAIVLRDVQGFSTEEAAEVLNITVASLKSRLHRGRVMLRKHLEGYLGKAD